MLHDIPRDDQVDDVVAGEDPEEAENHVVEGDSEGDASGGSGLLPRNGHGGNGDGGGCRGGRGGGGGLVREVAEAGAGGSCGGGRLVMPESGGVGVREGFMNPRFPDQTAGLRRKREAYCLKETLYAWGHITTISIHADRHTLPFDVSGAL